MIDTHTHLNFKAFSDDWENVIERALVSGVDKMIVVGTDISSSEKAVKMAKAHPHLYASVGVHPHHVRGIDGKKIEIDQIRDTIEKIASDLSVVAIGEVGLDYHTYQNSKYSDESLKLDPKVITLQKRLLGTQVEIAKKLNKPLIIHSREAGNDVLDTIEHFSKDNGKMPKGVFHCFDGGKKYLKILIEAGYYISFTGNVTYSEDRLKVASEVPLERLLVETDCPFMPPLVNGKRVKNKRSEPKDVKIIVEYHARARGLSLEKVTRQITDNTERLFGI